MTVIHHHHEDSSNAVRDGITRYEPLSLRTYTPTQAVLARSAGVYHWTPEGRRLYDFSSGVLVANLGHNPASWIDRFVKHLGWSDDSELAIPLPSSVPAGYLPALTMTAYNAITPLEIKATEKLVELLTSRPGGSRLRKVMWAASGSEAVQKALWCALARDETRPMILATRNGFHGKKGLAGAVTGCETDHERDPRVRFIGFPTAECKDIDMRGEEFDPSSYRRELEALWRQFGRKINVLITEPYLGGGGSYHPPLPYLKMLQEFCRERDIVFILDEVQSNFGRTGDMFAFETYEIEPDIVVLGKGLGNGVPVAASVGRPDLLSSLTYGEGSDTWSANPLCCSAVLTTLEAFETEDVLSKSRKSSAIIEEGLARLKELPFVGHVRGENGGMVWGVETCDYNGITAADWANHLVLACYRGDEGDGIHLLGPLAKTVVRIAPPLVLTEEEARESMELMYRLLTPLAESVPTGTESSEPEKVGAV